MDGRAIFCVAYGSAASPDAWQHRFATDEWPEILIAPTGSGKTAAVTLGWAAHRIRAPETTPRRLVWCLPMRTLVDQTARAAKIGELMRLAALSKFGWRLDARGRKIPKAPWQISGRDADGNRLKDPSHVHAFWLSEDADSDGLIDHVSVVIASGIDDDIRAKLDRITRLWLAPKQRAEDVEVEDASAAEWRLALEGFGKPKDFAESGSIFGTSAKWRSATPLLAAGHLKSKGYVGEVHRLLARRKLDARFGFPVGDVAVTPLGEVCSGGRRRRATHFHRFRSRGREEPVDASGTFLDIAFPVPVDGPLALGYASHFGLGLLVPV